jgi:serine/threonine protein kinase
MSVQRCEKCGHESHVDGAVCTQCGAPFPIRTGVHPDDFNLKKGEVIANRYTVQGIVGRGGMGCIYKVYDNTLGEVVALKTLLPEYVKEKLVVERFFNEARIARGLSHPNIVRVHDIGRASNGMVYISMEMVGGRSMRSLIDKLRPGQRLPTNAVLRMFDGLCAALEYAHQFTIHRDLKPENVMVQKDGSVKLMDFGISKLMSNPNLTSASMVMGTPHYMSPEQLKNTANVDARADIYSLGIMLYEVLTGDKPMGGKAASETVHDVPASIDPIIGKCLKSDPAKRYQSMAELRTALKDIRVKLETGTPLNSAEKDFTPVEPIALEPENSKMPALIACTLSAIVLAGVIFGFKWAEQQKELKREALQSQTASPSTSPIPPASLPKPTKISLNDLSPDMAVLKSKAETALRADAQIESEWVDSKINELHSLWRQAQQTEKSDPIQALTIGWQVVHQYLAILLKPKLEGMLFIPPGPAEPGYFIATKEVQVQDFNRFVSNHNWRPISAASDPSYPVVNVTFYDAVAFARHQSFPQKIPTREQYQRAFTFAKTEGILLGSSEPFQDDAAIPFRVWGTISEWTRSIQRDVDQDGQPWFGDTLSIATPQLQDSTGYTAQFNLQQPFGTPNNRIGFRCVFELPRTLKDLRSIMSMT